MKRIQAAVLDKCLFKEHELMLKQKVRMKRFGMAVVTFALIVLATNLVLKLGLGKLNFVQYTIFIGVGVTGNVVFFVLFYTNMNLRFRDPSLTREQMVYSAFWGMLALYFLPEARPIILMFYLPAFCFGMLRLTLRQYLGVVAWIIGMYGLLLTVEYLENRQRFNFQYELFLFAIFCVLLIWMALFGGFVSSIRQRLRIQNDEIREALDKVKTLSGLLPICATCKKIRDDKGYWNQIEAYIGAHSEAEFSHSICPDCLKELYPDLEDEDAEGEI